MLEELMKLKEEEVISGWCGENEESTHQKQNR